MSKIEWTTVTWNPTTGCDRVSPGCDNCYALTMAKRLKAMGQPKYQRDGDPRTSGPGFGLTVHPDVLEQPLRWRKPRRVFVDSMSDLFHSKVPDEFVATVFAVMALTPQHTYQILTKRPARMRALLSDAAWGRSIIDADVGGDRMDTRERLNGMPWPLPNVWLGTSVEDQPRADQRIPPLLDTPAAVRFLSCEPLLGPVDLQMVDWDGTTALTVLEHPPNSIDWVIVGGESGSGARPMNVVWARRIVDQCRDAGTAAFVKQLGSVWAREHPGHQDLKGGDPGWWPEPLRVREFPREVVPS